MQVRQLDHLNLSVRDLDESIEWYARIFGFVLRERGLNSRGTPFAVVQAGTALLCLYHQPGREFLDGAALRERAIHGLNHFALRIDDREEWEETLEREGLELMYGGLTEYPHSLSWYVTDPTGYEVEVALWNDDEIAFD
jgi:lactoylglutathione lyase